MMAEPLDPTESLEGGPPRMQGGGGARLRPCLCGLDWLTGLL